MFPCWRVHVLEFDASASLCIMWVEIGHGIVMLKEGLKLDACYFGMIFSCVYFGVNLRDAPKWVFHFFFIWGCLIWFFCGISQVFVLNFFEIPFLTPLFSESLEPFSNYRKKHGSLI